MLTQHFGVEHWLSRATIQKWLAGRLTQTPADQRKKLRAEFIFSHLDYDLSFDKKTVLNLCITTLDMQSGNRRFFMEKMLQLCGENQAAIAEMNTNKKLEVKLKEAYGITAPLVISKKFGDSLLMRHAFKIKKEAGGLLQFSSFSAFASAADALLDEP